MNRTKILCAVALAPLLGLAACASEDGGNDGIVEESTTIEAPAPSAPTMEEPNMSSLSADEDIASSLEEAGSQAQDAWYLATLRDSGIENSNSELLTLRAKTCAALEIGDNIMDVTDELVQEGYNDEQLGVIIASSMVSSCPGATIDVDARDLPDSGNTDDGEEE